MRSLDSILLEIVSRHASSCPRTSDHERSFVRVQLVRATNRNLYSELILGLVSMWT